MSILRFVVPNHKSCWRSFIRVVNLCIVLALRTVILENAAVVLILNNLVLLRSSGPVLIKMKRSDSNTRFSGPMYGENSSRAWIASSFEPEIIKLCRHQRLYPAAKLDTFSYVSPVLAMSVSPDIRYRFAGSGFRYRGWPCYPRTDPSSTSLRKHQSNLDRYRHQNSVSSIACQNQDSFSNFPCYYSLSHVLITICFLLYQLSSPHRNSSPLVPTQILQTKIPAQNRAGIDHDTIFIV